MTKEKEEESISISFGLESFEIISYSFDKPEGEINKNSIAYEVKYGVGGDLEKNLFYIDFKIAGQAGKKDPLILGKIHTRTHYTLSKMKRLINDEGDFILPKRLGVTLLSIALSTTRGALVAKSEGNILAEAVLPLVNPNEIYEAAIMKGEIKSRSIL